MRIWKVFADMDVRPDINVYDCWVDSTAHDCLYVHLPKH